MGAPLAIAARAQLSALRLANRARPHWTSVPLLHPRVRLQCNGYIPLISYKEIFVERVYEPPVALPPPSRIFDIGGHLGLATLFFAEQFPGAAITVYEANPDALAPLRANVRHLGSRVTVLDAAIGPRDGSGEIFVEAWGGVPTDASLVRRTAGKVGRLERVQTVALATAVREPVDLVKLDIEGAEYDCLEAWSPDPDRVRALVVEFHDLGRQGPRLTRLLERFAAAGYRPVTAAGEPVTAPIAADADSTVLWLISKAHKLGKF